MQTMMVRGVSITVDDAVASELAALKKLRRLFHSGVRCRELNKNTVEYTIRRGTKV